MWIESRNVFHLRLQYTRAQPRPKLETTCEYLDVGLYGYVRAYPTDARCQIELLAMGYVVLPALAADISDVYDVYFAAFKNNAITRALFPSATTEELANSVSEFRYDTN